MRRILCFNNMTLDGYFSGEEGDISWAKGHTDPEFREFVGTNASARGVLLLGRITYQMMASYWPTERAMENDPVVAEGMNRSEKIVFSTTLDEAKWQNSTLVKSDPAAELKRRKNEPGGDMVILGSGTLVSQLAQAGLIDEFQIVLNPVVLGKGRTMFEGIPGTLSLTLKNSRPFRNGNVVLTYESKRV